MPFNAAILSVILFVVTRNDDALCVESAHIIHWRPTYLWFPILAQCATITIQTQLKRNSTVWSFLYRLKKILNMEHRNQNHVRTARKNNKNNNKKEYLYSKRTFGTLFRWMQRLCYSIHMRMVCHIALHCIHIFCRW